MHPALGLATPLRDRGDEILVAGAAFFQGYVRTLGFPYHPLKSVPFGMGFEYWVSEEVQKKKFPYWFSLYARVTDRLYADREKELLQVLDTFRPDVIVLDCAQATDFIILYRHLKSRGVRIAMFHAIFPSYILPGRPPVNSDVFPADEDGVEEALENLERIQRDKVKRQKLKYLGFDDRYLIARRLRKNGVPAKYISTLPNLLNFSVDQIPQFICTPPEFDFPGFEPPTTHHYVGFNRWTRMVNASQEYTERMTAILKQKDTQKAKLIYCAFGTLEADTRARVMRILHTLLAVIKRTPHILIVSTKLKKDLPAPSSNVHVFDFVPQVALLQHADLFVSHGGFNSIVESIEAEVPLLLYPVHDDFDPRGNTTRAVYHGMGRRGSEDDAEADMLEKITDLLENGLYKACIRRMKQKNARYSDKTFIDNFHPVVID
jgi:UDP:flavonoid glycosyltransferase YjiC (YdhE family)